MVPISKTNVTAKNTSFVSEKPYNEEPVSDHLPLFNSTLRGYDTVSAFTLHL